MRIKAEFEIDQHLDEDVEVEDLLHCASVDELESQLIDWFDESACYRVFIDSEDLKALWAEVEKKRDKAA